MAGFKSGAVDDDWDESTDEDDEPETESKTGETTEATTTETETDNPSTPISNDGAKTEDRRSKTAMRTPSTRTSSSAPSSELPWVLTRNSITDGRDKTVQLHLQGSTIEIQRDGMRDVESILGESVAKADLREAALIVGLQHSGEVAELLREWGYDVE